MLTITKDVNGRIPEGDGESEIVSSSPNNAGPPIDAAHVPKKLWRHSSMEVCANLEAKNESKVLVLYTGKIIDFSLFTNSSLLSRLSFNFSYPFCFTGGTIGMMRNENGGKALLSPSYKRSHGLHASLSIGKPLSSS